GKTPKLDSQPEYLSFKRLSERMVRSREEDIYDSEACGRCRRGGTDGLSMNGFDATNPAVLSAYGAILVESLEELPSDRVRDQRHDLCLFAIDMPPELEGENALPLLVEDLLQ